MKGNMNKSFILGPVKGLSVKTNAKKEREVTIKVQTDDVCVGGSGSFDSKQIYHEIRYTGHLANLILSIPLIGKKVLAEANLKNGKKEIAQYKGTGITILGEGISK